MTESAAAKYSWPSDPHRYEINPPRNNLFWKKKSPILGSAPYLDNVGAYLSTAGSKSLYRPPLHHSVAFRKDVALPPGCVWQWWSLDGRFQVTQIQEQ